MVESYYTPQCIRHWLRNWDELQALCESPRTARGLTHQGPTPEEPRIGRQRGRRADPMRWSATVADLELAALVALAPGSLEAYVVHCLMHIWVAGPRGILQHPTLLQIREMRHCRSNLIHDSFAAACTAMASWLGWTPPPDLDDEHTGDPELTGRGAP
jgi:hypothetical protein